MDATIEEFQASDGYSFRLRRWSPQSEARGCLVALHGIQSHSGWYTESSRRLCDAGWDVRFLDRRGSGLNESDRGHARHADRLIHDVAQILRSIQAERRHRPIVLLGLSWGGRLAACVAARHVALIDGLVLLYPGVCARVRPTWIQRHLLSLAIAAGDVRRTARIPLDDPALFTSNLERQEFIRQDPLALHEATVGFFASSVALELEALQAGPSTTAPTLMMLAGRDRIIDNDASRRWLSSLASSEKLLIEYPQAAHTLEFEPESVHFVDDLIHWLESRCTSNRVDR